jgi:hypothetical protein
MLTKLDTGQSAGARCVVDDRSRAVAFGQSLIPFAGIAFLWFIGVLRDRLGAKEDRFFAIVFFGSALLYLALLFVAAGLIATLILLAASTDPNLLVNSPAFQLTRAAIYNLLNVYATKMATVFMIRLRPS